MGKRRRSDANESEGEAPTTPSAKRASTDKWSFPDELKTAVGALLLELPDAAGVN